MARCGYIRRKIYRQFKVRSALLGVPLIWLMFICWTMYYTQSIQVQQSKRQLTFSAVQQNHIEAPPLDDNGADTEKPNIIHITRSDVRNNTAVHNVLNAPNLETGGTRHNEKAVIAPDINNRQNGAPSEADVQNVEAENAEAPEAKDENSDAQEADDENADAQDAEADNAEAPNADDNADAQDAEDITDVPDADNQQQDLSLQSTTAGPDYVEFVWKGDKPKPVKKFIIPGTRFDPPKLGEFGREVKIRPENLNSFQRKQYEEGWKNHEFNEYASLQISTQRETPDYRPKGCKVTDQISHLPKASIIICFFNEAWSVLLRTIHSILTKSPPELITEIILVDDYSNMVKMHEPLEYYVAQVDKLRLLRMTRRSGLVRARLAGVKEAKGSILIFLDSHVECEEGWLPPLLQTILDNPNFAVTPDIDVIDHKDFSIQAAIDNIGVLAFEGFNFDWASIMPRIQNTRKSMADPFKSPAMAGGLFAIRKDYFVSIGTYDRGLELWGGENIELSLKLWMCGGGILIHPCSRVAHIFRDDSPYLIGKSANVLVKNSARVAQVWADEYRDLYFSAKPYNEKKLGSVQERQELRKKLKCHSFSWYLENVYPEMYIANSGRYLGKINSVTGLCIHKSGTAKDSLLELKDCKEAGPWESTRIKEIRFSRHCMDTHLRTSHLVLKKCDLASSSQTFEYLENKSIYHQLSNTCLTASDNGTSLTLQPCNGGTLQTWIWPENAKFIPPYKYQQ